VVDAAKVLVDENPSQGVDQFVRKLVSAFGHGAMTALVEHLIRAQFDDPSDEGIDQLAQKLLSAYGPGAVTALVEHLLKNPQNDWDWTLLGPVLVEMVKIGEPLPDEATDKEKMAYLARWKNNTYDPGMTALQKEMLLARWQEWWTGAEHRFERTKIEKIGTLFTDTRFANYISKVALLDFGDSIQYKGEEVLDLILDRLKVSITFAILAFFISYAVSIPIGIYSAVRKDSISDRCITFVLFLLYATPSFYLATILLTYLTNKEFIAIFPTGGFQGDNAGDLTTLEYLKDVAWHIALPLACMTYASFATLSRYARAGLLEVIRSDYVRTARAKGLSEPVVILKHALRNGVIPILTMVGGILPALIGGSVIIETVFNINGMGKLMFDSIIARDYNVVMGDSLIAAFLVLCGILVSDITYVLVDPRISFD
jgi:peptide/nickel transport system permease protein